MSGIDFKKFSFGLGSVFEKLRIRFFVSLVRFGLKKNAVSLDVIVPSFTTYIIVE